MADSKLDELTVDVGRLQQQMHDLYALHRQLQHDLDDVLEKISRLKPEAGKPNVVPDTLYRSKAA